MCHACVLSPALSHVPCRVVVARSGAGVELHDGVAEHNALSPAVWRLVLAGAVGGRGLVR
jgi:hypothetical protein